MINTVCAVNRCSGCSACISVCPKNCIEIKDTIEAMNAVIDEKLCINCKSCEKVCPNITRIEKLDPIEWNQGWANSAIRKESTSGGAASAIMSAFIERGGYVASCQFKNGEFLFDITNDWNTARKFAGSKYVKSNPEGIYRKVQERLKTDKVLFIGLPCQVAALKCCIKNQENLYTIDLICHGTPSIKLLDQYLSERGFVLENLKNIRFRTKVDRALTVDEGKFYPPKVMDCYLCSFLESINYTENCYYCQFASLERVADITLGDSWGTEYKDEEHKGVSLILTQTEKGKKLLRMSEIELKGVNVDIAVANNQQLIHPSDLPPQRKRFLGMIKRGMSYKVSTFLTLPKVVIRQQIKLILISLGIIKSRGKYGITIFK